jgi:cob(I)alamin adenosyltransferase
MFPLSAAQEDSMRDPRIDDLIDIMEQLFDLYSRLMSEAASAGQRPIVKSLTANMKRVAAWWDRFASVEVQEMRRVHGGEAVASAEHVARSMARWHEKGEATGDLAFW